MAAERVRIAVIGAGRMGRVHLDALGAAWRAEAVAVVEPAAATRDAAAARGLAPCADLDELLEAGGFDAALIAAPTDLHVGLVERLAGGELGDVSVVACWQWDAEPRPPRSAPAAAASRTWACTSSTRCDG